MVNRPMSWRALGRASWYFFQWQAGSLPRTGMTAQANFSAYRRAALSRGLVVGMRWCSPGEGEDTTPRPEPYTCCIQVLLSAVLSAVSQPGVARADTRCHEGRG